MYQNLQNLKNNSIFLGIIFGLLLALPRFNFGLHFVIFIAFYPLFYFLDKEPNRKELLKFSFSSAATYTIVGLHWIMIALHWMSPWVALVYFLLIPLFTFYFYLTFRFSNLVWMKNSNLKFLTLILTWTGFETLTHFGEFRFPWFHIGYSLSEYLTLLQSLDLFGMTGLTCLILIINSLLYKSFQRIKLGHKIIIEVIIIIAIFLVWNFYGIYRLKTIEVNEEQKSVAVIQANFDQNEKWSEEVRPKIIPTYLDLSLQSKKKGADLVIWPESAVPYYLRKNVKRLSQIAKFNIKNEISVFTGFQDYKYNRDNNNIQYSFFNSASLIDKYGVLSHRYDKQFLVPFGERTPFLDKIPLLNKIQLGQANFEYGKKEEYFALDNFFYTPLICFEIVFPELITKCDPDSLDFVVNLTNDAWFRKSVGTYQHSEMTKFRAIETRTQYFRAANTGISMIVDPLGRVLKKIPLYQKDFTQNNILSVKEITFYHRYFSKVEPYLIWLIIAVYSGIFLKRKNERE